MTESSDSRSPEPQRPNQLADRYLLGELLGTGGMASVYRARDVATDATVALKLLTVEGDAEQRSRDVELFEREFHTLSQLVHPCVVQVFDYGVDDGRPYYTMELLDGGDLREKAPLPWQRVAMVAYEICSVLALLHSRRLVHRDLTPRNIRLTADGRAKLIDFGLLSPLGQVELLAGTAPFVAPELVNTMSLDGRSDLFSLGATLYLAVTGRFAYTATRFDRLRDAWRTSPVAPSQVVHGIPEAFDDLLLALLRIDVGSRPKSAAEVMHRLLPLLETAPDERLSSVTAYLTAPGLIGREQSVARFRKQLMRAARWRGGGFVIAGEAGMGRSRMLETFALEAKLVGATTLRASAAHATAPFGVLHTLAQQLLAASPAAALVAARRDKGTFALLFQGDAHHSPEQGASPRLIDFSRSDIDGATLQSALQRWILAFASQRTLAIAVDDIDRIDAPSAAVLMALAAEAPAHALAYAVSVEAPDGSTSPGLVALSQCSEVITLAPLTVEETTFVLQSVFGDVPHVQLLGRRFHDVCGGRPRDCMMLAHFFVDRGDIAYAGGSWTLPANISAEQLPASIEQALAHQVRGLSPLACRLARLLALGLGDELGRAQLRQLPDVALAAVDGALAELLAGRFIAGTALGYSLAHRGLAAALTASLSVSERADLHQQLTQVYERSDLPTIGVAYHMLLGHRPEQGLDFLLAALADSEARARLTSIAVTRLGPGFAGATLELAVAVAGQLNRGLRDLQVLYIAIAAASAQGEDAAFYYRLPPTWLERLKQDSGWHDWQAQSAIGDATKRCMTALGAAVGRYRSTPESERVLSPEDAIKQLTSYVACSLAVAIRALDLELMATLPPLLEPFAPLGALLRAMYDNAQGTLWNGEGKRERARQVFIEIHERLGAVGGAEMVYVEKVRASLSQTLGEIDASLGIHSPWVARLAGEQTDPNQAVGARYLLKVACLQRGDWESAEKHRHQAELLTLHSKARPMFSTLGQELEAHAMARDLTGLKQVNTAIQSMATVYPGWLPVKHVSDAHYLRLCGNLPEALRVCCELSSLSVSLPASPWLMQAAALEAEILVELGRPDEAIRRSERALRHCEAEGMGYLRRNLDCAVAMAEAKLGQYQAARARLQRVLAEQVELGVTGLQLGRSYELLARIAIWSGDAAAFQPLAEQTAEQYRPGLSSVLGALYERLMEEARQAGMACASAELLSVAGDADLNSTTSHVTASLGSCSNRADRTGRALSLLCDGEPPARGYLFVLDGGKVVLAAANTSPDCSAGLTEFAQTRVDEEASGGYTVTATPDLESAATVYVADGLTYRAQLLGTVIDGDYCLAGIAVLSGAPHASPGAVGQLVGAIAKVLIAEQDSQPLRAL